MSDEQQFYITVRFPGWEQEIDGKVHKFKPFAVRYLFITDVIPFPDWPEEDERWLRYSDEQEVVKRFVIWYQLHIKQDFDGEVLFVEPAQVTIADGKADRNA